MKSPPGASLLLEAPLEPLLPFLPQAGRGTEETPIPAATAAMAYPGGPAQSQEPSPCPTEEAGKCRPVSSRGCVWGCSGSLRPQGRPCTHKARQPAAHTWIPRAGGAGLPLSQHGVLSLRFLAASRYAGGFLGAFPSQGLHHCAQGWSDTALSTCTPKGLLGHGP